MTPPPSKTFTASRVPAGLATCWADLSRRALLGLGAAAAAVGARAGPTAVRTPAPTGGDWVLRRIAAPEPLRQIRSGGPRDVLAVGAGGALWALSGGDGAATRLGEGLDPLTPLAAGHGRVAARHADGGLWVWQDGPVQRGRRDGLAPRAGLLVLPLAVIAVAADGHQLIRLEPVGRRSAGDGSAWVEVARSVQPVLPDARPVQADLDGRGDDGHVVVLAGPDARRYRHGVLGDAIEATRMLWLERDSLQVLREGVLPAPHVMEDIAPRPVALAGRGTALLTVRSGPLGGQLGLMAASAERSDHLQWAALGDALGIPNRWMSPTTDGSRVLSVHTPHIGGVLHEYRLEGGRLVGRVVATGVSTHRLDSRELDLAVWMGSQLMLPEQDGRGLRVLDADAGWRVVAERALPDRVAMSAALPQSQGAALLLDSGQVLQLTRVP
jgi:hypothetical protein